MRILHLSSLYPPFTVGGAERVVQALAEGMAALGHSVTVTHLAPQPLATGEVGGVALRPLAHRNPLWIERVGSYPAPLRNLNKIATLFNPITARDLARLVDELRPDIVHTHSMVELPPRMWPLAKRHGAALVHTLHDYDLLCIRASLYKDGKRCLQRHAACAAFSAVKRRSHGHIDQVVGVTRSVLDTHLAHGLFESLPERARHVVWNPVRAAPAAPRATRPPGSPTTFGFLGRLVPEKGILTLLEACRQLPPGGWRLKIGGRAPGDAQPLHELAAGLPVEFMGFVDPAEFLRGIDVLLLPSVWLEPFGLTIVEAYAAGVRVIGSDVAGVAEIIASVDPEALVPAGDAKALAQKMAQWCGAAQGLPEVGPVLARTQPEQVVKAYLGIYAQAIAERRGDAVSSRAAAAPMSPRTTPP